MKTKRFSLATPQLAVFVALTALVFSSGLLAAQPPNQMARHDVDPGARLDRMVKFLELSESQEAELEAIFEANRATLEENREAGRANRVALKEALAVDAPDASTVGQLVIDGKNLREQAKADREALQEQIATVLTEEQLAKWEGFQRGRHFDDRRGSKRGPRGSRQGGAAN